MSIFIWSCPCDYTLVADIGLGVSALLVIGGDAFVLSAGDIRPTSNVNTVSILLKDISMVEIWLSSIISEINVLTVLSIDSLRQIEAVFALRVSVAVPKVKTDPASNWGINVLDGSLGQSSASASVVKPT